MAYYKNKSTEEGVDVVYIQAESNPNEDYYFECTEEEVVYSLKAGAVTQTYQGMYIKGSSNHV
jgi:hypothetical protein